MGYDVRDMTTLTDSTQDTLLAPMPVRALGNFGWRASVFTLGGVKWDTQIPEAEAVKLVHRAIELGVNTFDTASGYGNGQSETRLGLALQGHRDKVFVSTKTGKRDYDGAKAEIEQSLKRLRTDHIDLYFVHSIESDEDTGKVLSDDGVLKAMREFKDAGHIKHIGVSGHWFKHNMIRAIQSFPFEAVLLPAGLFNEAYGYSFVKEVVPIARQLGLAVMGMKVLGAGRAKHAADITPYLRFSYNQDIDTAVIGCDSIAQLEQNLRILKSRPAPLPDAEAKALFGEAHAITQEWEPLEFSWVQHYV
jgi:aryl-alcohol dehydrogenase-like predicted oxidoreductase